MGHALGFVVAGASRNAAPVHRALLTVGVVHFGGLGS
jgi:hypothetical protein